MIVLDTISDFMWGLIGPKKKCKTASFFLIFFTTSWSLFLFLSRCVYKMLTFYPNPVDDDSKIYYVSNYRFLTLFVWWERKMVSPPIPSFSYRTVRYIHFFLLFFVFTKRNYCTLFSFFYTHSSSSNTQCIDLQSDLFRYHEIWDDGSNEPNTYLHFPQSMFNWVHCFGTSRWRRRKKNEINVFLYIRYMRLSIMNHDDDDLDL